MSNQTPIDIGLSQWHDARRYNFVVIGEYVGSIVQLIGLAESPEYTEKQVLLEFWDENGCVLHTHMSIEQAPQIALLPRNKMMRSNAFFQATDTESRPRHSSITE